MCIMIRRQRDDLALSNLLALPSLWLWHHQPAVGPSGRDQRDDPALSNPPACHLVGGALQADGGVPVRRHEHLDHQDRPRADHRPAGAQPKTWHAGGLDRV